jgi:hypothetical protein
VKIRVKQKDIIVRGWFKQGPNPDQPNVGDRGWFVYPEQRADTIPVMIVKINYPTSD